MSAGKKMVSSLVMLLCSFLLVIVVQTVLFQPIFNVLLPVIHQPGMNVRLILFLLYFLKYFISFFVAAVLYTTLIARCRFSALWSLLSALGYGLLCWVLINYLFPRYLGLVTSISSYIAYLLAGFGFSVMYVFLSKAVIGAKAAQKAAPVQQTYAPPVQQTYAPPVQQTYAPPVQQQTYAPPVQQQAYANYGAQQQAYTNPGAQQQAYTNPGAQQQSYANYGAQQQAYTNPGAQQQSAGMDPMSAAILNAIRPSLKAPLSAVLCRREEMTIREVNGTYEIQGYVHSQNSYGAMIATDFKVTARYCNGSWIILNTSVGVQNAKNYTKSFVANYIVISIFVGVMGLLGYFILSMIVGF